MNIPGLLKSKKFWSAVIPSLIIGMNDALELGLSQETIYLISGQFIVLTLTIFGVDWKYTAKTGELNPKYKPTVKPDNIESINLKKAG